MHTHVAVTPSGRSTLYGDWLSSSLAPSYAKHYKIVVTPDSLFLLDKYVSMFGVGSSILEACGR